MTLGTVLITISLLMLNGTLLMWPHGRNMGHFPSGGLGVVLVAILTILLLGRI